MVRAKFKVDSKTIYANGASVKMVPVTCGSEENKKFFQYTPGGSLDLQVLNHEAAEQLVPGKEYYIDITEA